MSSKAARIRDEQIQIEGPGRLDVKAKLAALDLVALLGLLHDLYSANNNNQAFVHARFGLGADIGS